MRDEESPKAEPVEGNQSSRDRFLSLRSVLSLVAVFTFLNVTFLKPWTLSQDAYSGQLIFAGAVRALLRLSARSVALLLSAAVVAFRFRRLGISWLEFESGSRLRVVAGSSALLLAWMYSTYEYNYFADQAHLLDRIGLVILAMLSCWRPVFVGPFLLLLWPMLGQFNTPIKGASWAIPFLPARVLLLFFSFFLLGLTRRAKSVEWPSQHVFFVLLCLLAGHYISSGYGKLSSGWLQNDQLYYLLPNTYANGWLASFEPEVIDRLVGYLSTVNLGLKVFVILGEAGVVLALCHPRVTRGFLSLWILFHVGVAAVSGIAFWPWLVVHLSVLATLRKEQLALPATNKRFAFIVSVVLIAAAAFWVRPVNLTWIDSPANYTYRISLVDENNQSHEVPPSVMVPFEYRFTAGAFHFLSPDPVIPVSWGATRLPIYDRLKTISSEQDVLRVETEIGEARYDRKRAEQFSNFLTVYFQNRNAGTRHTPKWLRAPMRLWTVAAEGERIPEGPIREVRITQLLTATIEGRYQVVRSQRVLTVRIPKAGGD